VREEIEKKMKKIKEEANKRTGISLRS